MAVKALDDNGLLYLWGKIKAMFVQKETGKGLSANDYTTAEKTKLAGLENYTLPTASASVKGGVKVGVGLAVDENGVLNTTDGGVADSVEWTGVQNKPSDIVNITTRLADKIDDSEKGSINGVAPLGSDGLIPSQYIAGSYEDIVDGYYDSTQNKFYSDSAKTTELEKVVGRIYVDLTSDPMQYRWSGSVFTQVAAAVVTITNGEIDTITAT